VPDGGRAKLRLLQLEEHARDRTPCLITVAGAEDVDVVLSSDAFIVAPGGIGTVLETMMIWQLLQVKHLQDTPLILVGNDVGLDPSSGPGARCSPWTLRWRTSRT
jgi:predicted Rossmann-fold nucleotide-binding protein